MRVQWLRERSFISFFFLHTTYVHTQAYKYKDIYVFTIVYQLVRSRRYHNASFYFGFFIQSDSLTVLIARGLYAPDLNFVKNVEDSRFFFYSASKWKKYINKTKIA